MKQNQIVLASGTQFCELAQQLLEYIDLAGDIGSRDQRIGIKPNLVISAPASSGATTHPELVTGVIAYLQQHGFHHLKVMEGSWVGARTRDAYAKSGLKAVCEQYHVPFYDLQNDTCSRCDAAGMQIDVCDHALQTDYLINMPVLKGHCQTGVTCALKNAKGLIPDREKRRFHTLGLHKPIAHLNTVLPRGMILVDNICGDLCFEEGGNPVVMNRILCCKDPVLCDAFVCNTMGYDLGEVPYIQLAEQLGVGNADLSQAEIISMNDQTLPAEKQLRTRKIERLARHICEDSACSACYGALIYALNKLDEEQGLSFLHEKICIGQGFRQKSGALGVGACTSYFHSTVKGCPPTAADIVRFLRENG